MGIKIREFGTVIASFATPQEIVVDHANDSIRLGDGTDLITSTLAGGKQCLDVRPYGAGDASAANQTSGDQLTQLTDSLKTDVAEIDTVGAEKALKVSVIATVGGGTTPAATDDAAFTVATDSGVMIMGLADETAPDSVDEGDAGALRMTLDRLLKIQIAGVASGIAVPITDNGGNISIDDGGNVITVDGTVAVTNANLDAALSTLLTEVTGAAIKTSVQLLDDTVFVDDAAFTAATSKLLAVGATYQATPDAIDDGDIGAIRMTANRELMVQINGIVAGDNNIGNVDIASIAAGDNNIGNVDVVTLPSLPAGTNNIGDVDVLTLPALPAGTNNIGDVDVLTMPDAVCVGKAAHDAAVSGNPVRVGGKAMNTSVTKVSNGDTADLITDLQGALVVYPIRPRDFYRTQVTNITNTTETTIVTAGGAGVFNDIISIVITNNSDVQSTCSIKDSTAGTTRMTFLVPARGGVVFTPCVPLPQQAAANNNWTATMGTTSTATDISVMYVIQT